MKFLFTFLLIFSLCNTWSFAQDCTIGATVGSCCTLTMDGNLIIPGGFDLEIEVEAWGAGGGTQSAQNNNRHGGGGGAYFKAIYPVTACATFPITVGQGAINMDGGDTFFDIDGGGFEVVGGGGMGGFGNPNNVGKGGIGPLVGSTPGGTVEGEMVLLVLQVVAVAVVPDLEMVSVVTVALHSAV